MDDLSAMMGMGIEDDQQMQAMADALRGRKRAADFFAATSIPAFQQMASAEQKNIADAAGQAGVLRRALEERRAQDERARLNREAQNLRSQLDRESRERIAAMRPQGGGGTNYGPYGAGIRTAKEREKFKEQAKVTHAVVQLADAYDESYGPMVQLPGMGEVENFIGRYLPFATDDAKAQAKWWSDFEEYFSLLKRHDFFGSAFTKTEEEAWNRAYFGPSVRPELVKAKLAAMKTAAQLTAEAAVIELMSTGMSPELIQLHYGSQVNIPELMRSYISDPDAYYENVAERKAGIFGALGLTEKDLDEKEKPKNPASTEIDQVRKVLIERGLLGGGGDDE